MRGEGGGGEKKKNKHAGTGKKKKREEGGEDKTRQKKAAAQHSHSSVRRKKGRKEIETKKKKNGRETFIGTETRIFHSTYAHQKQKQKQKNVYIAAQGACPKRASFLHRAATHKLHQRKKSQTNQATRKQHTFTMLCPSALTPLLVGTHIVGRLK